MISRFRDFAISRFDDYGADRSAASQFSLDVAHVAGRSAPSDDVVVIRIREIAKSRNREITSSPLIREIAKSRNREIR